MRYSKEFLNEKYKMLPEAIKDMMGSLQTAESIKRITGKHKLHINEAGLLSEEITYVMVGATRVGEFIKNLKMQLRLPDEKINAIARDVNESIFIPMREAMKRGQGVSVDSAPLSETQRETQRDISQHSVNREESIDIPQGEINHAVLSESQDIKKQIASQQIVTPPVLPPVNLPTADDKTDSPESEKTHFQARKLLRDEKRFSSEDKKPAHVDPYREPID